MLRSASTRLALATALITIVPSATVAQGPTPEGVDWQLVGYSDGGGLQTVPWYVEASLRLEDGQATGSAGCNGFGGSYELDGLTLTFSESRMTTMGCPEPIDEIEVAYLSSLESVASYGLFPVRDDELLWLLDSDGETVLLFHTPVAARLDALQARVDRHEERIDSIRIGALRDRIKTLEGQVQQLSATPAPSSGGSGSSAALNAAEKVLLEAVPADIAADCVPRRSDNPSGTVAALQCKPDGDPVVRDMAYYLMNENNAAKAWTQRMKQWAVPDDGKSCWRGQQTQWASTGALELAGCYVDGNGRANLRYAAEVTNCRQLDAGDTHIKRPAVYIAVLGQDGDIASLTRAIEPREWAGPEDLVERLERPGAKWDPSCPR